jgi:hypothetical protein
LATALPTFAENPTEKSKYVLGELAGVEYSKEPNQELTEDEKAAVKELCAVAARRDFPARLLEVVQSWESALFFRGFQFLLPQKGGGWKIPGESTGYGPSMQMDLSLLPTNIYSANAQIIISTLTRAVPNVRWAPQDAGNAAQITAAESAYKFVKVIERNNDLVKIQTDASRYLWTDGRFCYYTRFVKDGQQFGWEEDDQPDDIIPENEPPEGGEAPAPVSASPENPPEVNPEAAAEVPVEGAPEEAPVPKKRTPRGQEVRTAHGKLEVKLVPMFANNISECDCVQFETEVDESRAKGMFPEVADEIKAGQTGLTEGQIARLARLNVKLGMQSTYITSDSVAKDVTLQRSWFRTSALMGVKDEGVRDSLIAKFPDGMVVCYAGETLCYARNEGMDDCWALGNAFSGDGQNRNALGTSLLPIQKRINNWLDLMNDYFIRTVAKKWMDSKAFAVDAIKAQPNVPGDIGPFKRQPGVPVNELIFVEPVPAHNPSLPDFVKEYIGPISQLIGGAYPALSGGDTGSNDTKGGIITQRNQALGRLGQTWHAIQNAEATSMGQAVRWGAKCRDKSINERIPGGEAIQLEINNLKANILCYPEADDSFPESHIDKQNRLTQFMQESAKNPVLQEVFFNAANLEFLQGGLGLTDLVIKQVVSRNKQLAEIELLLKAAPVPNPMIEQAKEKAAQLMGMGVDAAHFDQAQVEAEQLPPEVSSVPIDPQNDDDETEADTCWLWINLPEGRKAKRTHPDGFKNISLHRQEHLANAAKKAGVGQPKKPPSVSINYKDVTDPAAQTQILAEASVKSSPEKQPAAMPKLVKPAPENTPENHPANAPHLLRNKPEAGSQVQ